MMSTGKVVLGTLAGVAIGAIAGILFAPDKGSRTRQKIMDKGNDYVEDLKEMFEDFLDSVEQKFEHAKSGAEDFVEKGKEKFEDAKRDFKNSPVEKNYSGS